MIVKQVGKDNFCRLFCRVGKEFQYMFQKLEFLRFKSLVHMIQNSEVIFIFFGF